MPDVNHDTWDHEGVTGVPAAETFTEIVHDAHDHAGVPGVGSGSGTSATEGSTFGTVDLVRGFNLNRFGTILDRGGGGSWDAGVIESPNVFWDPREGRYGMVYVGYGGTSGSPTNASVGLAWSDDLVSWAKEASNPILAGSGVGSDPDEGGTSGPFLWYEDGTYHLFYIGMTGTTYESGTKSLCHATATDPTGTWTRLGAVVSPAGAGWRATAIWHPNIVKRGDTYYLFFNANGSGAESIGYATSSDLDTWTVDDVNSPLIEIGAGGQWDDTFVGDPYVYRIGSTWYMVYYGNDGGSPSLTQDGIAYTSDADFPLGWTKFADNPVLTASGATGADDEDGAGKACIWITPTAYYHYYTARDSSGVKRIALALERASVPVISSGSGAQLDYVERTTSLSVTATSEATAQSVVSAGALSFDGSTQVEIEFSATATRPDTGAAGRTITFYLYDGSSSIGILGFVVSQAANSANRPIALKRILTPSAASHTYSVRAAVNSGTGTVTAGAGGTATDMPGFIRIRET